MKQKRFTFRVWLDGKFIYPQAVEQLDDGTFLCMNFTQEGDAGMRYIQDEFKVIDKHVMQFTGLYDKNDVGIYEFDCVRIKAAIIPLVILENIVFNVAKDDFIGLVAFKNGTFCLAFDGEGDAYSTLGMSNIDSSNLEVIGNAYEGAK